MIETDSAVGFVLVNKPAGMTSFACVHTIKKLLGKGIKVGHAGTLDPFATGLLIIAMHRQATRELAHLSKLDKVYIAQGKIGELTDTLDRTGTVVHTDSVDAVQAVTKERLQEALASLGDVYEQVPPIFSALKHKGMSLYALARKGEINKQELHDIVATKKRIVQLYSLELESFEPPFFTITAHVSHGTYIRSLVNDCVRQFGVHATTYQLQRDAIGPFTLDKAVPLDQLASKKELLDHAISLEEMHAQLHGRQEV